MMVPTFRLGERGWPRPGAGPVAAGLVPLNQMVVDALRIRNCTTLYLICSVWWVPHRRPVGPSTGWSDITPSRVAVGGGSCIIPVQFRIRTGML